MRAGIDNRKRMNLGKETIDSEKDMPLPEEGHTCRESKILKRNKPSFLLAYLAASRGECARYGFKRGLSPPSEAFI